MLEGGIPVSVFKFLETLKTHNNREWFTENKSVFKEQQGLIKSFFFLVLENLRQHDEIDRLKLFRIYRDVRFSSDKTPYKSHFSGSFHRVKPRLRGGYYLHIEPGNTFLAAGFWDPEKGDLHRIRKEFETDDSEIRKILNTPQFKTCFGNLEGEELKSAPRGFDKEHPAIDLIRRKQYIVTRKFSNKEAASPEFLREVDVCYKTVRPYFNYMSEVLTTDLNGVSLID